MQRCDKRGEVHLELNLARDVSDYKFFLSTSVAKEWIRKTWPEVLNEMGALVTESGLLNAFFASTFTAKCGPQELQLLEARQNLEKERLALDQEGSLGKSYRQTRQPQIHGSWSDAPASAEGIGRYYCQTILHIFLKVMENRRAACRLEECHSRKWQEEEPRKLQAVSLTCIPGNVMGQFILDIFWLWRKTRFYQE